jgi:hypothetical protein
MDPDPDSDLDPAIFIIDVQDASIEHTFFCLLIIEAT